MVKCSPYNYDNQTMTNEFEKTIFSQYAFVGWVWTIAVENHQVCGPGDRGVPTCPTEFLWLGDTPFGWRMDAAMRKGWSLLDDDARAFSTAHLLPLCATWLTDMLLGRLVSRGLQREP